ncbi:matrix protein [Wufeng Murina leucogaster paramyxovirus 1]|nr:matrix protein [Wufeng Murina leucogaster paramyxovirus 1]
MDGSADFLPASWTEGGTLPAFEPESDEFGKLVPKLKVINPGGNSRRSSGYMYLIVYGIIEIDEKGSSPKANKKDKIWCLGSFPLGVGKTLQSPEVLLDAVTSLSITVRRTAGYDEKIVYGTQKISPELQPWSDILRYGAVFPATKVCAHVEMLPLDKHLKFRPVFLTVTQLTDAGIYKVPRNVLEFRYKNAISFNLLVAVKIGADLSRHGIKGVVNEEGKEVTTFMVHIGNFARKRGKVYSADYCRKKVDKMDLRFSLGAIGGLSLHVRVCGKMSHALRAQLGYKKQVCYSLMDTNPYLNKFMWKYECAIDKVTAVFQPSVPTEFKIYNDVIIDHTGKIMQAV